MKYKLKDYIEKNQDKNNAEFENKLIKTKFKIYGLKTKLIEKYALELAKENLKIKDFLPLESYEEVLICGIMIGKSKINAKEKVEELKLLLPYIDNWGSCDCILSRLKNMESEKDFFFSLLGSQNPFYQRFGIVWILKYFLKIDVKTSLFLIKNTKNDDYYLKMAKSWAYAEAFLYNFDLTTKVLFEEEKDSFVVKKAVQKALESYRVSEEQKLFLREKRDNCNV